MELNTDVSIVTMRQVEEITFNYMWSLYMMEFNLAGKDPTELEVETLNVMYAMSL